ncbi:flagellar biosynthesis protein FlhB [Opitutales bacterium ASA1]|uniref:EscU/YscU/HrcU family type III secretion system export apparatus switch protein n=1 Tax=Congregicoccus parvus TaxID=3081749 RepID=UPI002B2AE0B8|nr:flagellar biosynthesis protein FlhB [Opitutales bacterium ASA1]
MAETDQDQKTEEPTAKRLSEAFQEGQFAQSPDVGIAVGLIVIFCLLLFVLPGTAARVGEFGISIFGHLERFEINEISAAHGLQVGVGMIGGLVLPIAGTAVLAGVIAGGMQTGFRLTPKVLELKWNRLDPLKGFQRVISMQVLVRFGIDLAKMLVLAAILWAAVHRILEDPIFYTPVAVGHIGGFIRETALYVVVRIALASIVIAAISYAYQWRKTRKDLMMTREEVKQERKNAEIDPQLKAAQRALARRLMQRQMLDAVPTADVVVTNPTHFAVALKYERGQDRAPVVLAKGRDVFARRIKEIAARNEVPMVENRPVARALFKYGQVGKEIPAQLYQVVAEILGFVYRTHRYYFHRLKARRMGMLA